METNRNNQTVETNETFEVALKCTSRINERSLALQEEARHIQMEQDQKQHFYGLYSISAARPGNSAEYECFSYAAKYSKTLSDNQFEKQINLNGNRFTQNRPYTFRQAAGAVKDNTPTWLSDFSPEDCLWGIGVGNIASMEVQSMMASIRAVVDICWQLSAEIQMQEEISRQSTSLDISRLIRIRETITADNSAWSLWQIAKADVKNLTTAR